MTPFSLARPSSLRKEGKSAVLDYWQFKVLHSALICFTNPASPNFFTGRAGFDFVSHGALAKFRCLGLLTFTRFIIPFQIFILKIFHSINLVHMGTGCFAHGVPAQNPPLGLLEVQSSSLRFDLFHKSRVAELFHRTCWVRPSDSHGALAKIRKKKGKTLYIPLNIP